MGRLVTPGAGSCASQHTLPTCLQRSAASPAGREWYEWRALHRRLVLERPSAPAAADREALRARGGALLAELLALVQARALDGVGAIDDLEPVRPRRAGALPGALGRQAYATDRSALPPTRPPSPALRGAPASEARCAADCTPPAFRGGEAAGVAPAELCMRAAGKPTPVRAGAARGGAAGCAGRRRRSIGRGRGRPGLPRAGVARGRARGARPGRGTGRGAGGRGRGGRRHDGHGGRPPCLALLQPAKQGGVLSLARLHPHKTVLE